MKIRLVFMTFILSTTVTDLTLASSVAINNSDVVQPPNFLVIVIDTLRSDHMSCYGYNKNTTPNIDKLVRHGCIFTNCYSTSSWTLPACTSLMTGLYTQTHKTNKWDSSIPKWAPFLPRILAAHGYYCSGVSSNPFLSEKYGFASGFHKFDEETVIAAAKWSFPLAESKHKAIVLASTGATATRTTMQLLNNRPHDKPFFIFIHYMDCHADYVPPPPFDTKFNPDYSGDITGHVQSQRFSTDISQRDLRHVKSLYDGEIAYTDFQVAQLLEHLNALNLENNTCVVLTADHGEEFLEHGNWGHGYNLFNECLRIPLIIRWPGKIKPGTTINIPVSIIDIMPTILDAAGLNTPQFCPGTNLITILEDDCKDTRRSLLAQTALGNPLTALITQNLKLITRTPDNTHITDPAKTMVFDLKKNPKELFDKQLEDQNTREQLLFKYVNTMAKINNQPTNKSDTFERSQIKINPQHHKMLKSLGYIGNDN